MDGEFVCVSLDVFLLSSDGEIILVDCLCEGAESSRAVDRISLMLLGDAHIMLVFSLHGRKLMESRHLIRSVLAKSLSSSVIVKIVFPSALSGLEKLHCQENVDVRPHRQGIVITPVPVRI